MTPVRVGFVVHVMQVAGAEVLVAETIRRLGSRIEPTILCLDDIGVLGERLQHEGVPVIAYHRRAGLDLGVSRRMARDLRARHIQVVHAHQYTPFFYGSLAARLCRPRPRVIFTEHGRHYPDVVSAKRRLANRWVFDRLANRVNAVCEFSAKALAEKDGFRPDRIEVIPNGIDLPKYAGVTDVAVRRVQLGLDPARQYVACVARFHPVKDHEMLLHAFAQVATARPNADLLLVGDGALRSRLEALTRDLGLEGRVRFLGVRDDVADILQVVDVFALTSVSEAASITLLEAMGAGRPVVVTGVGGNPEIVRDGVDGLLVPRGDHTAAAGALLRLLGDGQLARAMGQSGAARIRDHYQLDQTMDRYYALYAAEAASTAQPEGGAVAMFRTVFVLLIIAIGAIFSLQSAFYALLFYLWNAYFRPDYWTYGGFIMSLKLSLIVGLYLVLRTVAMTPSPKINLRTMLIWAFFGQCIVGCFTSENSLTSWLFLQDFAKVLIITYLIVVLVNDRKQFRLVILVMAMSLGFETAKQGWAGLIIAPGASNTNPIAFLGDNNGVAVGTMMLVPILGALAQTAGGTKEKLMHRFVAIGVFMKGLTTYSRGGFLGAAALGIVQILRAEKKIRTIIVVALLSLFVWQVMPDKFWERMGTINVDDTQRDESAQGRLHFWEVAVEMANAKPMTGVGLASYNKSYERYNRDPRFTSERAAHSIWFGVLGDLGYMGLVLFILNLVMAFWSCYHVGLLAKRNKELRDLRIYGSALISSLVVFCVAGSFVSGQYNEMAWHFFGLATALHFIAIKESRELRAMVPLDPKQRAA